MKAFFKKGIALTLVLIFSLGALVSCTVSKKYPGAPDNMRPVNDGSCGIIIYIPTNWSVDNSVGIPTAYFSYTDRTMVNLVTVPAAELGGKSIPEYFNEYKEKFKTTVQGFELIPPSTELEYTPVPNPLNLDMFEYQYKFNASENKVYRFAQTFFKISPESDLYIITYSTTEDKFETHYKDIVETYATVKIVNEPVPLPDDELPKPEFSAVENTPDGYSAITGEHVNYVLFVPNSWTPLVNTGITAASKADDPTVSCSITGFNFTNDNNKLEGSDYDNIFDASEKTLKTTFGNITFPDASKKYTTVEFAGVKTTVKNQDNIDVPNETAARKYVYSIQIDGIDYIYEQYMVFHGGYVYILTLCCKASVYAENIPIFNGIASNFKFTD